MKLQWDAGKISRRPVAPLAGAWIETTAPVWTVATRAGRPPRGGVD